MNVHVIMPFYRKYLVQKLIDSFRPMNLIWHPICDEVDLQAFENNTLDWIKPVLCPPLNLGVDQCYRKNNDFINTQEIIDEDFYGFLHDDDMYVPGFIDKIRLQTAKIIFYSMDRGDVCPNDDAPVKWPAVPIILSALSDVRVYNIDMCQMIVRGEILRQTQFGNSQHCDDGLYAESLKKRWPNDCIVMSEFGVRQNYFQKGRFLTR